MEGKFRKRAETVWCPRPQPARIVTEEDVELFHPSWGYKAGQVISKAKKVTGWTNMGNCSGCPYLEEHHIEGIGVFCTYPKELQ